MHRSLQTRRSDSLSIRANGRLLTSMSIHDLKMRMADAGIEALTMGLEAGRILLRWNGYSAAVDASASDAEIEAAVRNAIKLPPVSLIPEKPPAIPAAAPPNGVSTLSTNPARSRPSGKQVVGEATPGGGPIKGILHVADKARQCRRQRQADDGRAHPHDGRNPASPTSDPGRHACPSAGDGGRGRWQDRSTD